MAKKYFVRKAQQPPLIDDILDNPTAACADRCIELEADLKETKELLKVEQKNLLGMLRNMNKSVIRHKKKIIRIKRTEAKETVTIQDEKEKKNGE